MNANVPTPSASPKPDQFVEQLQASLRDAFGVSFHLWVRRPPWTYWPDDASHAVNPSPLDGVSRVVDLFEAVLAAPDPLFVTARPDGEYLVVIPVRRDGENPLVAAASVSLSLRELIERLGALALKEFHEQQRLAEDHLEIDSCANEISKNLERLEYLQELVRQLELCDISRSMIDVAQSILPTLRGLIRAEAVILFSAVNCPAGYGWHTAQVGSPAVWTGLRVVTEETCYRLLDRFREGAMNQPVVVNRFSRRPEAAEFPDVESFILAPVVKDDFYLGWLLALNRVRPAGVAPGQDGYPSWGLSDNELGSSEAELARVTGSTLATHGRNVQLLQMMCDARDRARAASTAKSRFLANMSRDIRTPLNAILGYADLLLGERTERFPVEEIEIIKRNAESMLRLLGSIPDLSTVEEDKMDIELVAFSPKRLVADVRSLMSARAAEKGLKLSVEHVEPIPETIRTDPTRLKHILLNLVSNAVKFTETGSVRIVTRLTRNEGSEPRITFTVIDTGIGMTKEEAARVFQPFDQTGASTTGKYGGTGLGLAISRRLAELLGGDIAVASIPGEGSSFEVSVPTGPLDSASMEDAQDGFQEAGPLSGLQGARILLAEDCPDNQKLTACLLERAGATVTAVENGDRVVERALAASRAASPFDIILMDMDMPETDGYTATATLRAAGYRGPIVALTAHAMNGDREKSIRAGCDDYITKPIKAETLISVLATHHGGPDAGVATQPAG